MIQGIVKTTIIHVDSITTALPYNNSGVGSNEDAHCQLYVQWLPFNSVRPYQNIRNRLGSIK